MLAPSPYPPFAAVDVTFVITGTAVSMVNVATVALDSVVPALLVMTELAFPARSVARTVTLAVPSMYVLPVAAVTV